MFSSYRSVSSAFKAAFAAEGFTGEARRRVVFVAISWRVAGEVRDRRPHGVAAAHRLHPAARLRNRGYPVGRGTRGAPAVAVFRPASSRRILDRGRLGPSIGAVRDRGESARESDPAFARLREHRGAVRGRLAVGLSLAASHAPWHESLRIVGPTGGAV